MGHFARVRAPGAWISLGPLHAAECETFDADLFKALNADDGGSWAPAAQIVLGGAGLKVNGPVEGTWVPSTQIVIQGAGLEVTGPSQFTDCRGITFNLPALTPVLQLFNTTQAIWHDNTALILRDNATLHLENNSSFIMDGGAAVTNPATWSSTGTDYTWTDGHFHLVNKTVTLDSDCTVTDASTATRTGPTTRSGANAYEEPRSILGANADTHYDGSTFDIIRVPQLTGSDRTYTLDTPANNAKCTFELFWYFAGNNPGSGQVLGPTQAPSTKNLNVNSSTGSVSLLLTASPSSVSGDGIIFYYAKFHFNGTDWRCLQFQHP